MKRRFLVAALTAMFASAMYGCGEDTVDAKGPWGAPTPTTVSTLTAVNHSGTPVALTVLNNETVPVKGKVFSVTSVGTDPTGANPDIKAYVNIDGDTVTFGGGEIWWGNNGGYPFISGTADTPVVADLDPPLYVDQTVPLVGTAYMGDPNNPSNYMPINTVGTYRAVEKDATVATAAGVFSGVTKFTGETSFNGTAVNAVVWYHPDFGMVKGSIDWPPPTGSSMDLTGVLDLGTDTPGTNVIRRRQVISDTNGAFELNTYQVGDGWTADRSKHAKMLLEMRFTDETSAMNPALTPNVSIDFGTTMGYFGYTLVPSPISFFHPEENGKGYTFWVAYVDQAGAKWDHTSDTYHIKVNYNYGNPSPIQVTARIIYQKFDPATAGN